MGDAIKGAWACAAVAFLLCLPAAAASKTAHGHTVAALASRGAHVAVVIPANEPKHLSPGAGVLASVLQGPEDPVDVRQRVRSRVPEPAAFAIIGSALVALGMIRRRRQI